MEAIKFIYEGFGGRNMDQIFRRYFLLMLLLKQMIFALFFSPVDHFNNYIFSTETEKISGDLEATESVEKGWDSIRRFQHLFIPDLLEIKQTTASKEKLFTLQ